MDKVDEINKILEFYTKGNILKTTITDEDNNYSIADNLFGSMILATVIDSEFHLDYDLSKIYRMLLLPEICALYPNYNFETLKLGKQYLDEIKEAIEMKTNDSIFAFKCKILDLLLTTSIKNNINIVSKEELIKECSSVISKSCDKEPSECNEIFKFYYLNTRLKNKVRSGWDSKHWGVLSDRIERISEHVIGCITLSLAMNSVYDYNFDINKVLKMLVLHETGETLIGDITPFDGITPDKKKEIEHEAMEDALGNLKEKADLLSLLFEFDEQKTSEAKFSHYVDKIEAVLQSKIYQDKGLHRSLDNQENNCVFKSSKVQKMLIDGAKDAFDIWYEWDKTIYEGDSQFPEFIDILKTVKDNNLVYSKLQLSRNDREVEKSKTLMKKTY